MTKLKVEKNEGYDLDAKRPDTTYSAEYIRERAMIDGLAKTIQNQILQLNKRMAAEREGAVQIIDFGFKLSTPSDKDKKPLPKSKGIYMRLVKFFAWFPVTWRKLKIKLSSESKTKK